MKFVAKLIHSRKGSYHPCSIVDSRIQMDKIPNVRINMIGTPITKKEQKHYTLFFFFKGNNVKMTCMTIHSHMLREYTGRIW